MHLEQLSTAEIMRELPHADGLGWFVARQPGVLRHLEQRLLDDDALAATLAMAWRLCAAFEHADGVPPARISASLMTRAEAAVAREAHAARAGIQVPDGLADRQPDLCQHIITFLETPPVPLAPAEQTSAGLSLAALLYSLDHLTTGRPL